MKKVFTLIGWILAILLVIICIGFVFPSTVSISRSASIKASSAQVYEVLTDLTTYNQWMTWNQKDPAMKVEWGAKTKGQGASYKWFSNHREVGNGELTISEVEPQKKVTTSMVFGESPDPSLASWTLHPANGGTEVQWNLTMNMGMNPIGRWFGKLMKGAMENDFDKGLAQLKEKMESGQLGVLAPTMTLEEGQVNAMKLLVVMDTAATMADIGPILQKAYGEMAALMKEQKIDFAAAPLAWYHTTSAPYIIEAAIPVSAAPANTNGRIKLRSLPAAKAVIVRYYGPYEQDSAAYSKIADWMRSHGATALGKPYEHYVDDPTSKASMYETRTDIIQLLR